MFQVRSATDVMSWGHSQAVAVEDGVESLTSKGQMQLSRASQGTLVRSEDNSRAEDKMTPAKNNAIPPALSHIDKTSRLHVSIGPDNQIAIEDQLPVSNGHHSEPPLSPVMEPPLEHATDDLQIEQGSQPDLCQVDLETNGIYTQQSHTSSESLDEQERSYTTSSGLSRQTSQHTLVNFTTEAVAQRDPSPDESLDLSASDNGAETFRSEANDSILLELSSRSPVPSKLPTKIAKSIARAGLFKPIRPSWSTKGIVYKRLVTDESKAKCISDMEQHIKTRLGKDGEYSYQLLGECYIHGMMDGEAMLYQNEGNEGEDTHIPSEVFEIR